ncbi:MAG: complex I 51 kDa subunit family protein [Chloroflexota bacterium]
MPEQRIVLRNCGIIDPRDVATWRARGGLEALRKARDVLGPDKVIEQIKASGLRGRGGAGFPAGLKWELVRKAPGDEKYVICNADEGEPGTYKDRYILERDPFTLIEGIAIACFALGAGRAYVYLRDEYHDLRHHLDRAIAQVEGEMPLGCQIIVHEGAGAYVCGEESALMESLEGKRGEPRFRPPFPPSKGLWGKPTAIHNIETLMNVSQIVLNGAEWFSGIGTAQSKGTKVLSVSGDVRRPGVVEVPLGTPLREVVEEMAQAEDVKLVQVGGASGRVIPADRLDTPLAFESCLGAGAIIVFNSQRDVVEIARETIAFFVDESCGKCTPCRQGARAMLEILNRLAAGRGIKGDLVRLQELAEHMALSSLCGLGQAAPNFVADSLQCFGHEYETRVAA